MEFGGSGEDSFVAVVVTKLTGALLFILLLTMVIMALIPRAVDLPASRPPGEAAESPPLAIATPDTLPEAIAGRPYALALAATGGRGPLRWAVDGPLPEGLALDPDAGLIRGTPARGTPEPARLHLRVSDGAGRAGRTTQLLVYQPDRPLTVPSHWKPSLPPIPWMEWVEQGFGFLMLALVHLVGLNTLDALERRARNGIESDPAAAETPEATAELVAGVRRRFRTYRAAGWVATTIAVVGLGFWLVHAGASG